MNTLKPCRAVYYLIYATVAALAVLFLVGPYVGIPTDEVNILAVCFSAIIFAVFAVTGYKGRLIIICGIAATVITILLVSRETFIKLVTEEKILIVLLFSFACLLISILIEKAEAVRIAAGIICAAAVVFVAFAQEDPIQAGVSMLYFLILMVVVDEVEHHWKKSGTINRVNHVSLLFPFLVPILVVICFVPAPKEPYDWAFAKNAVRNISEWIGGIVKKLEVGVKDDYFGSVSGFSDSGEIGGDLSVSSEEMLTLDASVYIKIPDLYLGGMVYDTFDGRSWSSSAVIENASMIDTLETLTSLNGEEFENDYVRLYNIGITYVGLATKHIFTPAKTCIGSSEMEKNKMYWGVGGMLHEGKLGYGDSYRTVYYILNRESALLGEHLNSLKPVTEEEWNIRCKKFRNTNGNLPSYRDYLDYKEKVYEVYGQRVDVSDEVREYVDGFCVGALNDMERLVCIERLLQNYRYTLSPGELPDKVDSPSAFLDYFMLDSRAGYCNYFATAFVLLARSMGIPARLTEGWHVPESAENIISVDASMAHVWPEVYIENFGWLSFEPTPGNGSNVSWTTYNEAMNSYREQLDRMKNAFSQRLAEEEMSEEDLPAEDTETETTGISPLMVVIPLACCLALLFIIVILEHIVEWLRFRRMNERKQVLNLCGRNLKVLKLLGFKMNSGETLEEFAGRVSAKIPPELLDFIPCYEQAEYSENVDYGSVHEAVAASNEKLCRYMRKENFFAYIRYKIQN